MTKLRSLIALQLLGCFQPDLSHYPIRCDAQNACPTDQACLAGLCTATNAFSDMASGSDLSMSADLQTGPSFCKAGGGFAVGKAWACPGTFAMGTAAAQCAAGSSICTDANSVDLAACGRLNGFYIANVPGKYVYATSVPQAALCGTSDANTLPVWFGCGNVNFSRDRSLNATNSCSGFNQNLDCQLTWNCSGGSISQVQNSNVVIDGVLCCKP